MNATAEARSEQADVVIVGAGPAGLSAAAALARAGAGRIVVIERDSEPGGVPRHSAHQGFGLRDQHRMLSGPRYAARLTSQAEAAGAELWLATQATGWAADGALELTAPAGRQRLAATAVVLASGCRERSRAARLIAGQRPAGVMTTGMLQRMVHLEERRPGQRAIVLGAEHVSFSALATLTHAGVRPVGLVTELPRHQTLAAFRAAAAVRYGTPLHTSTRLAAIRGRRRVESVELLDQRDGTLLTVPCDLVVLSADWAPEAELAALAGADLDAGTRGPAVDAAGRTSRRGLFAFGNVVQGAEPADAVALAARRAAGGVLAFLAGEPWPQQRLRLHAQAPLQWVSPNALSVQRPAWIAPPAGLLLRSRRELWAPRLQLLQDGAERWRGSVPRLLPGRSTRLTGLGPVGIDADGGPLELRVLSGRGRPPARTPAAGG